MRSAGRVTWMSRALMVLGFLSLLAPGIASASASRGGGARQVKNRTTSRAKDSKKKMALQRSKMGREKKGGNSTKAAGSLPRPGAGKSTTSKASSQGERGMFASAIAGPTTRTAAARPGARARTTKASAQARSKTRRPVTRKTRTAKKTRRPTAKKRRAARTQRNRSRRSSQGLEAQAAAAELAAADQRQLADDADGDLGPEDMDPDQMVEGPSRRRKILTRIGIGVAIVGGAAVGLAGGWAFFPLIAGLTSVGSIPGTAIVAAVIGAGLSGGTASYFLKDKPERMAQQGGLGESGAEKLRRWASKRQLENAGMNGAGVGAGVGMNGPGLSLPGQIGNLRDGVGPN